MPKINKSALVPYSTTQMFELVADVDAYANFLPWCGSSTVHARTEDTLEASIEIKKGIVNKAFKTRNQLFPHRKMTMELIDGPFKYLRGYWEFKALQANASKISLNLEYEFSNRIIAFSIGSIFNQVANTMVNSFVEQARKIY